MADDPTRTFIASATELSLHLQRPLNDGTAWQAIRFAQGQLLAATQLRPWPPVPCPDDIWAWTLELAGFAYSNAEDLETKGVDVTSKSWSRRIDRRMQILAAAEKNYAAAGRPTGSFPRGVRYPDPAERYGYPLARGRVGPYGLPAGGGPGLFGEVAADDTGPAQ